MISLRFPIAPKMQKFAMTKCVSTISGIADIVETFLPSPPDFYGDPDLGGECRYAKSKKEKGRKYFSSFLLKVFWSRVILRQVPLFKGGFRGNVDMRRAKKKKDESIFRPFLL